MKKPVRAFTALGVILGQLIKERRPKVGGEFFKRGQKKWVHQKQTFTDWGMGSKISKCFADIFYF